MFKNLPLPNPLPLTEKELEKREMTIEKIKLALSDAGVPTEKLRLKRDYIQRYLEAQAQFNKPQEKSKPAPKPSPKHETPQSKPKKPQITPMINFLPKFPSKSSAKFPTKNEKFIAFHTDDYRTGPKLSIYKWNEYKEEYPDDQREDEGYKFTMDIGDKYIVYYLLDNAGDFSIRKLKEFSTGSEADQYAKSQYYYRTQEYPSIIVGEGSNYKPITERQEIKLVGEPDLPSEDEVDSSMAIEYLIVAHKNNIESHNMNEWVVW